MVKADADWGETDQAVVREEILVGNACGGKQGSHGSKGILLSHAQGVEPSGQPLSAPTHQHWQLNKRQACHQTPDALNHRVGPQPGCHFKCLIHGSTEQDPTQGAALSAQHTDLQIRPQPGGPLYVLNRRIYGERLAKEAFGSPATRGSIKDSDGAITPAVEAICVPEHLASPGSLQAKQLYHLHTQLSLGQSCHRLKKKKSVVFMRTESLWS